MIITNLIGGLGNQLFQYACGHALAQRHGVPLQVATDQFDGYALHQGYEVARVFAVDTPPATPAALRERLGPWRSVLARRLREKLRPGIGRGGRVAFEPPPGGRWWPGIETLGADVYVHGYWQSERYFEAAAASLRAALRFRTPPSAANAHWLERIDGCASVSVHLRRGDYVSNPKNRRIYAECEPQYYREALSRIRRAHAGVQCFVFSDDLPWARQALGSEPGALHFVDVNRGADSWNDLRLMSRCSHHVIANSSFSWWAAWLGERPGKTIVAPARWYLQPGAGPDLVPQRWLRV